MVAPAALLLPLLPAAAAARARRLSMRDVKQRAACSSRQVAAPADARGDDGLIGGPASVRDTTVLISGGGFSGLGAATTLVCAGVDTLLVEQGRGVGGRVCTRRVRSQPLSFDHGCQYLSPKTAEFASLLAALERDGIVARWADGRLGAVACGVDGRLDWSSFVPNDKLAYVGVPRQSSVGRHLLLSAVAHAGAGALTVAAGTRAAPGSLRRDGDDWLIDTHPKADPSAVTTTRHRVVIAAGSASSTFNVVAPAAPQLAEAAGAVRADACWGLMVAFAATLFGDAPCVCDGALVSGSDAIAWAANNSSKPGRGGALPECWVVHATPGWSNARRALKADQAAQELLREWLKACGADAAPPAVVYAEAFLWNAAFPLNPATPADGCFTDASLRLAMAGDWCIGPRAGDAWTSGVRAARAVLRDML
jgi:hypothetical protein